MGNKRILCGVVVFSLFGALTALTIVSKTTHADSDSKIRIFQKVVEAHTRIDPCIRRFSLTTSSENGSIPICLSGTTKANDRNHSVTLAKMKMVHAPWQRNNDDVSLASCKLIVNGRNEILYDQNQHEFSHEPPGSIGIIETFVFQALRRCLSTPKGRSALARSKMVQTSFQGNPAWCAKLNLDQPGSIVRGPASYTIIFDRSDYLIRKLTLEYGDGNASTVIQSYTRCSHPFSDAEFAFVPPTGSREVKTISGQASFP